MEATQGDGTTMFQEGKSLGMGKSYEITVGNIVLAVSLIIFCASMAGFMAGIKFDRSRNDVIDLGGEKYMIVGLGEVPGNPGVYMPVYKNMKSLLREAK